MNQQLHAFKYSFANLANNSEVIDIYIDGYVVDSPTKEILDEYYGDETSVSFKSFRDQITQSSTKRFNIIINSGGGHVGDALAMHDLIVDLESKGYVFNSKIIGICASAATYIGMAPKNSEITENSWFMIHTVSGGIWGNVDMIENYASTMRKFNDRIVNFYSTRTGISETEINDMMKKETWLTAKETVDYKFISKVSGAAEFKNAINPEHWTFKNREVLNFYNANIHNPKNKEQMDFNNIGKEIFNAISKVFTDKGVVLDEKDETSVNLQNSITKTLENSFKGITQDSIQEMVNKAITEATKGDAEALKTVVENSTKDLVKKDELKDFVNEKQVGEMIAKHIGNSSDGEDGLDSKKKKADPKNRFSGVDFFPKKG